MGAMFCLMETTEELNAGATETDRALMQVIGERVKKLREDATERLSQSGLADALTERGIKIKQGSLCAQRQRNLHCTTQKGGDRVY